MISELWRILRLGWIKSLCMSISLKAGITKDCLYSVKIIGKGWVEYLSENADYKYIFSLVVIRSVTESLPDKSSMMSCKKVDNRFNDKFVSLLENILSMFGHINKHGVQIKILSSGNSFIYSAGLPRISWNLHRNKLFSIVGTNKESVECDIF